MEGLVASLAALTPLNIFLAILGGVVFGIAYKDFHIDRRTIFLSLIFVVAFSIGRILFVATSTATGSGLVGTFLFLLYVGATLITRRLVTRGHEE